MTSVGEAQVIDITLQFDICNLPIMKPRLVKISTRNVMTAIHQMLSEFFIFQQDNAPANMALEAINFSP